MGEQPEILIVDDRFEACQELGEILDESGFGVRYATGGPSAVTDSIDSEPDLILMDIEMEGDFNGIGAASRIRDSYPHKPIIFVTAYSDNQTYRTDAEACGLGKVPWIAKPLREDRISELHSVISIELQKDRLRRILASDKFRHLDADILLSVISSYDTNFDQALIRSEMSKEMHMRKELHEPRRDALFEELEGEIKTLYSALQEPQTSLNKQEEIRAVLRSRQKNFAKVIHSELQKARKLDPEEGAQALAEAHALLHKRKRGVN